MIDTSHFQAFLDAQNPILMQITRELSAGKKESHWMWFTFPQLQGLGNSASAEEFGLEDIHVARAYLQHPVLGPRLISMTNIVNAQYGKSASDIFGYPDDMKFHSSMSLFAAAAPGETAFVGALAKYFGGKRDPLTVEILKG